MNGLEIKQALHAKGFTFAMLAQELDCRANVLTAIAYRKNVSRRAADAIAKALGKPVTEVFNDVPSYKVTPLPKGKAKSDKQAELRQLLAS